MDKKEENDEIYELDEFDELEGLLVGDEEFEEIGEDEEFEEIVEDEEFEEIAEDEEFEEIGEDEEFEEIAENEEFEEIGEDEEFEEIAEDEEFEEIAEDEEFEEIGEDEEFEEIGEDEEFEEIVEDEEFEEIAEDEELEEIGEDEEFEEIAENEEFEEIGEDEEFEEIAEDEEFEEIGEDEEFEEIGEDEEFEEIEEDEEFEEIGEDEEFEEIGEDEEFEEIGEDEEFEEIGEDEEFEEIAENEEFEEIAEGEELEEIGEDEEFEEIAENEEFEEIGEDEEFEEIAEDEEFEEIGENENIEEKAEDEETSDEGDSEEKPEKTPEEIDLETLSSLKAEYIFLGLLLNNPKAVSRYYFLFEDCHFSDEALDNMYRIILFRESEQYAPAIAKEGFKLPLEARDSYSLKVQLQEMANEKNYDIEMVYTLLKKLFILKKNYLIAPTKIIRDNILNIINYELYDEMTVEEVENAIEQIGVTAGLSQGRLNNDTTNFLLNDESTLATGAALPFPILSSVFKGIRKGETFVYAMPSNSGKSRFTINLASYLAFVEKKKVLIISNEMSVEKMRLCLITTILNNKAYQNLHGQDLHKTEGELLELKFRPDKKKGVKLDDKGFILRGEDESMEDYVERLNTISTEFRETIATTEWLNEQIDNAIYFIHITEHTNDDIRKIIMNYYYRENVEYIFYDTLKADTENIGNGEEVKKTATILSNLAQKFEIFIGSSMQLLESSTLPVNLTINDMSASRTVKEVLDTLCLIKQIHPLTLNKYEYSPIEEAKDYHDLEAFDDPDVRYYACVVDKNRAGAKPKLLFRLNLAYNFWEELGYVRLKQEFQTLD